MKEPGLVEIKLRSEIPMNSRFMGWVIWNPIQNDFLWHSLDTKNVISTDWIPHPNLAMRFNRYKKALKVRDALNLKGKSVLAALFDSYEHGFIIGK